MKTLDNTHYMKNMIRLFTALTFAAVSFAACDKDKVDYNVTPDPGKENIGFLALGGMQASVMVDTENIATPTQNSTRAGAPDIDTFTVTITDAKGVAVQSFLYGERPAAPIELPGGVYKLTLKSGDMAGADWDAPVYGASTDVVITRKQTTTVEDIVCKLTNIKVTVGCSADLADQIDIEKTSMKVTLAPNSLTFAGTETRAGYFTPTAEKNTLHLELSCRYKGQDSNIDMTADIPNVKACQWRKINVVIQHSSDGTATIGVTCDTWAYDEEIVFDTATYMCEEVIADEDELPTIVGEGHDLSQVFTLTDDMVNEDGAFLKAIPVVITAKAPLARLTVEAASDNPDFVNQYTAMIPLSEDLCHPTVAKGVLQMMGYPLSALGQTSVRLRFGLQAVLMHDCPGTHTYKITAVDEAGRSSSATLTVSVGGASNAPRIEWIGHTLGVPYIVADDLECKIRVTAPEGIAGFTVDIISDVLTPSILEGVGITSHLDLVNPGEYKDKIEGLGFPTGDAVYGKTLIDENTLGISSTFMGLLQITGKGVNEFRMTVTDAAGQSVVGRIILEVK